MIAQTAFFGTESNAAAESAALSVAEPADEHGGALDATDASAVSAAWEADESTGSSEVVLAAERVTDAAV